MTPRSARPRGLSRDEAFAWHEPVPDGECLIWSGTINEDSGYGYFKWRGRRWRAHRLAWELRYGPISEGWLVDHVDCVSRACINTDHLRLVDAKQSVENRAVHRNSKTGVRGVVKVGDMFVVYVTHRRKTRQYGRYSTLADAEAAAIARRNELFTHNNADRRSA